MSRAQGRFSIPYPEPEVLPLFHVPLIPHFTSLSTYHQQAHSFSCSALSLIPSLSAKYPRSNLRKKKKQIKPACLPIRSLNHQPHRCLVGIFPVSVSLYISIYLSTSPINFPRITRYSSLASQQQHLHHHHHQANQQQPTQASSI